MLKIGCAVLGALTLLVASGISASVASATGGPFWHAAGTKLFLNEARQIKLQSKGALVFKAQAGLEIECRNSISEGGVLEGSTTSQGQAKGRLLFSSCTVPIPAGAKCIVGGTAQIKTNPLKSYLAKAGQTNIVEVFEPGQGMVIAVVQLANGSGGTCPFKEVGIDGSTVAEVIPAEKEEQENLISFPSTAILKVVHEGTEVSLAPLKIIGFTAVFTGAYAARLANFPEKFGAFET